MGKLLKSGLYLVCNNDFFCTDCSCQHWMFFLRQKIEFRSRRVGVGKFSCLLALVGDGLSHFDDKKPFELNVAKLFLNTLTIFNGNG